MFQSTLNIYLFLLVILLDKKQNKKWQQKHEIYTEGSIKTEIKHTLNILPRLAILYLIINLLLSFQLSLYKLYMYEYIQLHKNSQRKEIHRKVKINMPKKIYWNKYSKTSLGYKYPDVSMSHEKDDELTFLSIWSYV